MMGIVEVADWETGKVQVPDDLYEPVWRAIPIFVCPAGSMFEGCWQWRKYIYGLIGQRFGVMLSPDFYDVLDFAAEGGKA